MTKYTDEQKQEIFNEWLNGVLNKLKQQAILDQADILEMDLGKQMNADDEFTADFKIIIRRKGVKK